MTQAEPMDPIEVGADAVALPVGEPAFTLALPSFEGPVQLLLHLIESRELDVLTVPLAEVADAYVEHLSRHAVDTANPPSSSPPLPTGADEPDEEELRRRLLEYRALRDAAVAMGRRDGVAPVMRREPRESDLPDVPAEPLPAIMLAEALAALVPIAEPAQPRPEIVAREITIGQQITVLREALSRGGRVVLQAILERCGSRTERAVTFLATLELVRRRQVSVVQDELFGPIVIETLPEGGR
jgi:segregation and condensation protein A